MLRDRWKLTIEQEDSRYINLLLNKKTRSLTIFADGKRMAFLQAGIDILGIGEVFRQRHWDTTNWEEQLQV